MTSLAADWILLGHYLRRGDAGGEGEPVLSFRAPTRPGERSERSRGAAHADSARRGAGASGPRGGGWRLAALAEGLKYSVRDEQGEA